MTTSTSRFLVAPTRFRRASLPLHRRLRPWLRLVGWGERTYTLRRSAAPHPRCAGLMCSSLAPLPCFPPSAPRAHTQPRPPPISPSCCLFSSFIPSFASSFPPSCLGTLRLLLPAGRLDCAGECFVLRHEGKGGIRGENGARDACHLAHSASRSSRSGWGYSGQCCAHARHATSLGLERGTRICMCMTLSTTIAPPRCLLLVLIPSS